MEISWQPARGAGEGNGRDGAARRGRAEAAGTGPVLPGAGRVHGVVGRVRRRGHHAGHLGRAGPGDPGPGPAGCIRRDSGPRDPRRRHHTDPDADGQGGRGRPDRRARARRRRLRDQAVQPARAGAARPGHPAPRLAGGQERHDQLRRRDHGHRRAEAPGHRARPASRADPDRMGHPGRPGHGTRPGLLPVRADQPGPRVRVRGLRADRRLARQEPAPQGRGRPGQPADRPDRARWRVPARPRLR
jgi:hypothetical protein